jgi:hypothetical protein
LGVLSTAQSGDPWDLRSVGYEPSIGFKSTVQHSQKCGLADYDFHRIADVAIIDTNSRVKTRAKLIRPINCNPTQKGSIQYSFVTQKGPINYGLKLRKSPK